MVGGYRFRGHGFKSSFDHISERRGIEAHRCFSEALGLYTVVKIVEELETLPASCSVIVLMFSYCPAPSSSKLPSKDVSQQPPSSWVCHHLLFTWK